MRKLKVRHALLPGIGERFELWANGGRRVVVSERSGRRELSIFSADADEQLAVVSLARADAAALAALLVGAHIELMADGES